MPATPPPVTLDTIRVFAPHDLAHMQSVIEAVSHELGIPPHDHARREALADRVLSTYARGNRLPLNMVSAGLAERV